MKAPRFASLTVSLDTERYRARRPEERSQHIAYLVDRLLAGEEVADTALEHYGLKVAVRPAFKKEII
jgi:hypothetical protein